MVPSKRGSSTLQLYSQHLSLRLNPWAGSYHADIAVTSCTAGVLLLDGLNFSTLYISFATCQLAAFLWQGCTLAWPAQSHALHTTIRETDLFVSACRPFLGGAAYKHGLLSQTLRPRGPHMHHTPSTDCPVSWLRYVSLEVTCLACSLSSNHLMHSHCQATQPHGGHSCKRACNENAWTDGCELLAHLEVAVCGCHCLS